MNCAELEILLCDYIDGTLPAAERAALELHLSGCPACTELAQDVQASLAFIERVATAEPPAELLTHMLEACLLRSHAERSVLLNAVRSAGCRSTSLWKAFRRASSSTSPLIRAAPEMW